MRTEDGADRVALLLAGGRSRRMGEDKAWLEWEGAPLWQRQAEKLQTAGAAELWVSCRESQRQRFETSASFQQLGCRLVADPSEEGQGPLMAIRHAWNSIRADRLLVVAVDLPRLSVEWMSLRWQEAEVGQRAAAQRDGEGRWETLAAVYDRRMLARMDECLQHPRHPPLQQLFDEWDAEGLISVQALTRPDMEQLQNCNTPTEWQSARESRS